MKTIIKTFSLIIAFVFTSTLVFAQGDFISAADAAKALKDKNTVVISAQTAANYKTSHLTNAVHIDYKELQKEGAVEGLLKSPADLAKIFGAAGVSNTNMIIIYDDGDNKYGGRVYWVLKYLGAANVKMLHKDLNTWRTARLPITKMPTKSTPATFTPKVDNNTFVEYDYVKANISNAKVVLVDVRDAAEFGGTSTKPVSKGHLPGAKNIEWKNVEDANGALLPADKLAKVFASQGVTKDKTVILYCATSVRAGIVYVALKSLGYANVKVYDGAYNEWVAKGGATEK
jgi:thiosulfate/3-mercaptopyruvate sulfurtransferase